MLIAEVRERYGPDKLYRLWGRAGEESSAERFVRRVSLRWERIADALAEDLLGRVRLPEDSAPSLPVLRVRSRVVDGTRTESSARDEDRDPLEPLALSGSPLELPTPRVSARGNLSQRPPLEAPPESASLPLSPDGKPEWSDPLVPRGERLRENTSSMPVRTAGPNRDGGTLPPSSVRSRTTVGRARAGSSAFLFGASLAPGGLPLADSDRPGVTPTSTPSVGHSVPVPPEASRGEPSTCSPRSTARSSSSATTFDWLEIRRVLEQHRERSLRTWEETEF